MTYTDSIPDVSNQVSADLILIKNNLAWLVSAFQAVCTGWSNSSVASLRVNDIADNTRIDGAYLNEDVALSSTSTKLNYLSTVTVTDSLYGLTGVIGTSSPSAASSVSFTGFTVGGVYQLVYNLSSSAAVALRVRFGNGDTDDTGSNYVYYYDGFGQNGSSLPADYVDFGDEVGGGTSTSLILNGPRTMDYHMGQLNFATFPGDGQKALFDGKHTGHDADDDYNYSLTVGHYIGDGANDVNRITIYPTSGTITGVVKLVKIG